MTKFVEEGEMSLGARLKASLAPALLLVLTLCLFFPITIYLGNIEEFVVGLREVLSNLFLPAAVLLATLLLIGALLKGVIHRFWVALVFAVALLLWIQGSLIVWDYGALDGINIDWGEYGLRGLIDSALWIVVIALSLIFSGRVYRRASVICGLLIVLQFAYLGFQVASSDEGAASRGALGEEQGRPQKAIFEFSRKENVVHVILDAFQSRIFSEIIAEDPERFHAAFDGFTFFEENTGVFTTTYLSIPAILSGKVYKNDRPMKDFFNDAMTGKTILSVAQKKGYEVDKVLMSPLFAKGDFTNLYIIPRPYGMSRRQHERINTAFIVDLALFRSLPHHLKRAVYNNQQWFFQASLLKENKGTIHRHFTDKSFLYDLIDNASVSREAPVYKYIHLMTSHPPYVVNEDCSYPGRSFEHSKKVATDLQRCALGYFIDFIDRLKEIGIYDSSLIILHADHGHYATEVELKGLAESDDRNLPIIAGNAAALFAIKPPLSKGPLRVSSAQTMVTDIPDTLSSLLGFNEGFGSVSVFDMDESEVRERRYNHMNYWSEVFYEGGYLDNMMPFTIKGSVFDSASWLAEGHTFSKEASFSTEKVDFGTLGARRYKRFGWGADMPGSDDKNTYTVVMSGKASLFLSLPADKDVTLTAVIAPKSGTKPVVTDLAVDGKRSGKSGLLKRPGMNNTVTFTVKPDRDRGKVSIVEFEFTEEDGSAIGPERLAFESLTIKEN